MSSRVVLFEPHHTGHRMYYNRLIIEFAALHGAKVSLVTSAEALQSDEYRDHLSAHEDSFEVAVLPPRTDTAGLGSVVWRTRQVIDLRRRFPEATVVVPEGDKVAGLLAVLPLRRRGRAHVRLLIMRDPRHTQAVNSVERVRRLVKRAAYSLLAARAGFDVRFLLPATVEDAFLAQPLRASLVPDPVTLCADTEDVAALRARFGLDAHKYWFGVLGNIAPRKNLPLVAEAFASIAGPGLGLVVAGRVFDSERSASNVWLDRAVAAGASVAVVDRLLTDAELDAFIAASDAVVLAHSSEGPSGIFGKAIAAGTSVLTAGARTLAAEVERLDCGVHAELNKSALARSMRELQDRPRPRPRRMAGPDLFCKALLD